MARCVLDHSNLEEFSDPIEYDLEDSSDTGIAFYSALARETACLRDGSSVMRAPSPSEIASVSSS